MIKSLTPNMMVTEIKELYAKLADKVEIVKELHTQWYGNQEFYIKDCNGYLLGFAESCDSM